MNHDPWIKNLSNVTIPNVVNDVLRLGEKFSSNFLSSKNSQIFEIVKDVEINKENKINNNEQDAVRQKLTSIAHKHLNKPQFINDTDRLILDNIKKTKEFINNNEDLLVTKADKGNVTVILNKKDYNDGMFELLNNEKTYELLPNNPLASLQKRTFNILDNWRLKGFLDEKINRKDIITTNTVLAKMYGLPKIHKLNTPLRPVVSSINTPTYHMAKIFKNILTNSLPKPSSYIKNSFHFKEIIDETSIQDGYIMISLDVK